MEKGKSVLVMETEENVVKDIACSLNLVDIPVSFAENIVSVKKILKKERPAFIIARQKLGDDLQAGVNLAQELMEDEGLNEIPLVIMFTHNERSVVEEHLTMFDDTISLPVEFPSFADQVKEMLDHFSGGTAKELDQTVDQGVDAAKKIFTVSNNMMVAYGIQMSVLDELRRNAAFATVNVRAVPEVVSAVTRSVCESFDLTGFMN